MTEHIPNNLAENKSKKGKLKLYIGFSAGVGKTYKMLQEAHALKRQGVDIVLGYIETHNRPETHALLEDLEIIPRQNLSYKGVMVQEMDLAAILKRHPQIAIVDEIPHSNAVGCKHEKRYQDVLELLDAGIDVIGALNIQHLESLNELIERLMGVTVREIVPDAFISNADQIVNLDLAVEDLQQRLEEGKIYQDDKIAWALTHFFKAENLYTLRELALREVAESLERLPDNRTQKDKEARLHYGHILVCISSHPPHASRLLHYGVRMAGKLNTQWYVVYVETPAESSKKIDAESQRHLLNNLQKARDLGAQVHRIEGEDPVKSLLQFASEHHVADIVIGQSHQAWWYQVLGQSVPLRLVKEATPFNIHIVAMDPINANAKSSIGNPKKS